MLSLSYTDWKNVTVIYFNQFYFINNSIGILIF